jgi:phosphosulfolactate phosphohydrolase-like enzyme
MCGIPMPANEELPVEECSRIIDNMIDNTEIKVILNSECQYILEQKKEKEQLRYNKSHVKRGY